MNLSPGGPPLIMGILNVTPDSFSDGGAYLDPERAAAHALEMAEAGADIIDLGGESTRPGADRVPAGGQLRRVLPVIERLAGQLPSQVLISIDTTLADVAREALAAGAGMINDIAAGEEDGALLELAGEAGVPLVLMHKQGSPATMQDHPHYRDVVQEVRDYLQGRAAAAQRAGVEQGRIILDPGIGFGKTLEHNLSLLANLDGFTATGYPVLLGISRKRTLAAICGIQDQRELGGATCAATAAGVLAGVRIFRVHDVRENRQAADVAWAIHQARGG